MTRSHTRPARKADITELSHALGRAFYDDPVSVWIMPDPKARAAHLRKFFATVTRHHHLAGGGVEVATDGSTIGAAALWDPPGRWKQSGREQLMMLPSFILGFGPRLTTGRKLGGLLEQMKSQHPEEPHWYLAVWGVTPRPGQRLRPCADAVSAGPGRRRARTCVSGIQQGRKLPTTSDSASKYRGDCHSRGGPTLWPMWRPPR